MLGVAPGLKKRIGKCSQMPSYRCTHNVQLVSFRALWHVSKTVARVCMFSLPIMRSPGMCQQVDAQTLPAPNKIHMLLVVLCLPCFCGVKCRTVLNSSTSFLQQVKMWNQKAQVVCWDGGEKMKRTKSRSFNWNENLIKKKQAHPEAEKNVLTEGQLESALLRIETVGPVSHGGERERWTSKAFRWKFIYI